MLLFSGTVFVFREQVFTVFSSDHSVLAIGLTILVAQLVATVVNGFTGLFTSLFQAAGLVLTPAIAMSHGAGHPLHPDRAARQPVVRPRRHHLGADDHRGPGLPSPASSSGWPRADGSTAGWPRGSAERAEAVLETGGRLISGRTAGDGREAGCQLAPGLPSVSGHAGACALGGGKSPQSSDTGAPDGSAVIDRM